MNSLTCNLCFHHCTISENQSGRCNARKNINGKLCCTNYGQLTSIALDPIEKKPLYHFHPGAKILSVGSYGCNMSCPFCQNHSISMSKESDFSSLRQISPQELVSIALSNRIHGNIGIAYTYNEALVGYEFVRDCSILAKENGLYNVLVTNGMASLDVLEEILPYIDAMNIDIKGFRQDIYTKFGGDLDTVISFTEAASKKCHVELTSLIVPGFNDNPLDMKKEAIWIASLNQNIPLHITRYFPRYQMNTPATDISLLLELKSVAEEYLKYVYLGNC